MRYRLIPVFAVSLVSIGSFSCGRAPGAPGTSNEVGGPRVVARLAGQQVAAPISQFWDNFDENTRNTTLWNVGVLDVGSAFESQGVGVTFANGQLQVSPEANLSGPLYSGLISTSTWDLTNSFASIQVVQPTNAGSTADTIFSLTQDSANWYRIAIEKGALLFQQSIAGTKTSVSIPYSSHYSWWRIRHAASSSGPGVVYWETSPDGVTWTTQNTATAQIAINNLFVELQAGTYEAQGDPGVAIFDNFRVLPGAAPSPTPSPTLTGIPEPIGTPSPSPSPSVSPLPVTQVRILDSFERVEYANASLFKGQVSTTLARGEIGGFTVEAPNPCAVSTQAPSGVTVTLSVLEPITISKPSYVGSTIGTYYDAVVPYNSTSCAGAKYLWAEVAVSPSAQPGSAVVSIGDAKLNVAINSFTIPASPTLPIYMQVEAEGALIGHGLSSSSNVSVQGPLVQQYVNALRAHRIEPFKQNLVAQLNILPNGTLDVANWSSSGASFQQLVMNGAIGKVMFQTYFGPSSSNRASVAYLQAIEATIKAYGLSGAWTYLWDEPTSADMTEIETRAAQAHQYAPDLKTMVTTRQSSALLSLIDIFTPIVDGFSPSGMRAGYWLYTSCVAHGSCSNSLVGQLTGTNDLMVDHPAAHSLAYPLVVKASGGVAALYYDSMYAYRSGNNPWTNQYFFGGNGDGNMFYPGTTGLYGMTTNMPVPSLRLKLMREGSYIADYLSQSANGQAALAKYSTGVTSWSKSADDYRALKYSLVGFAP